MFEPLVGTGLNQNWVPNLVDVLQYPLGRWGCALLNVSQTKIVRTIENVVPTDVAWCAKYHFQVCQIFFSIIYVKSKQNPFKRVTDKFLRSYRTVIVSTNHRISAPMDVLNRLLLYAQQIHQRVEKCFVLINGRNI